MISTSNVRHINDGKTFFSFSTKSSITEREASKELADMIIDNMGKTIMAKNSDRIYTYTVKVQLITDDLLDAIHQESIDFTKPVSKLDTFKYTVFKYINIFNGVSPFK